MMQDNNDHESVFLDRVRRTLDDSADNLDARTLSQLTQARHRALEKAKSKPFLHRRPFWLSLAGLVTAKVSPLLASIQFPSTKAWVRNRDASASCIVWPPVARFRAFWGIRVR